MIPFHKQDDYTFEDILSLITNQAEESVYLEFKEAGALDKTDGKKTDVSKDVSSFANSDGGVIVYGIKEQDHKAHSLSYINGNEFTKEWLEQIITSVVQRQIQHLKIFPIRELGDLNKSIYVVQIPRSVNTPHISKDKRFYKRYNFQSVPMEEYEIRELYSRKATSQLVIHGASLKVMSEDLQNKGENKTRLMYEVQAHNVGDTVENNYKVNVYFISKTKDLKISWDRERTNYDYTWMDENKVKVTATGTVPIFPHETVNAIRFFIEVNNELIETLRTVKIEVKLFYAHGEDNLDDDFNGILDILTPRQQQLKEFNDVGNQDV